MQGKQSSVLPSQCRDFMTKAYWEKFFKKIKKEGADSEYFEWYGDYTSFEHLFKQHIGAADKVLHIGCGKSLLAENLYDHGVCKHILNVDFEPKSLEQMAGRSAQKRPEMGFKCLSLLDAQLALPNCEVVLDKGTLDAIFPHTLKQIDVVTTFFENVSQAINVGGRYIIISLLQEHIIQGLLAYFKVGWEIIIYETVIEKSKLYPFYVLITKLPPSNEEAKSGPSVRLKLLDGSSLVLTPAETVKQVKRIQLQNHFITQVHKLRQGQMFTLDLWSSANKQTPRFTLFIYDNDNASVLNSKTCGCFIVPQGKENSYVFGTTEGHKSLQKQAQMARFIVARMNAGHMFESLKAVQSELSPAVNELTPKGCSNKPCPFMTDGDEISEKLVVFESEEFVVEEFIGDDEQVFRRVVQKSNLDQTQSQVRIVYQSRGLEQYQGLLKPKPGFQIGVDASYLDFQAHISMIAGLAFLGDKLRTPSRPVEILILGGGTGSLSQFITDHFANVRITNIELCEDMLLIAKRFFNFTPTADQKMLCCDALNYVDQTANSHIFDCIIIDINSSDFNTVSPPPKLFLTEEFLTKLRTLLTDDGISLIMLNLVDRYQCIKSLPWDLYYSIKCDDEVNEVHFLINKTLAREEGRVIIDTEDLLKYSKCLETDLESLRTHPWSILNIREYVSRIKLKHPRLQTQAFQTSEVDIVKDGQVQEGRKEFYQQDLDKVQKKKNKRKKVNKNR